MTGNKMPEVEIYTDGACSGNPGAGGYGAVLRFKKENGEYISKELSCGYRKTTNNRMEVLAAAAALESLKVPCNVVLTSDSRYLTDAFEKKWFYSWIKNGWKTASKQKVKNADLWKRLEKEVKKHNIKWIWVKGHNGYEFNEICDRLAVAAYNSGNLQIDFEYENENK